MQIQSKFLGEIKIEESEIIEFQDGIPGFERFKKFALIALDSDLPIILLQSVEEAEISFILAYPFAFKKDYAFDLEEEDIKALQIEKEEDVLTYAIMTLKDKFEDSTLNLLAPIVINKAKKIGKQIVLNDSKVYSLKYPLNTMIGQA